MDENRWGSRWEERWQRRMRNQSGRSVTSGILLGAAIVAVGTALLLDNLGVMHFEDMWKFWPIAMIIYGISRLVEGKTPSTYIWGGLVTAIGTLLLLDNLDLIPFRIDIGAMIWPVLIIGFGVSMLLRSIDRKSYVEGVGSTKPNLGIFAIFSGFKRRIDAQDFKGGEVVAVFGGVKLDLRHAGIAGDRAVIDINAMFGGIDIRVPETWTITMKGIGIFGAFEDKTIRPRPEPGSKSPELVITGFGMFAGVKADN